MEASALQAPAGLNRITVAGPLLRLRSDEQLVALFRQGHDAAFQVIHDRYRTRLLAYSRQMLGGSRQDAEDALQDVFLRAYGALRANDRPLSLRAWLYRVAHNRCIDQLRRPTPPASDVYDTSRVPVHDPLAESERREDLRRLVEDVRRLPEQQRSALLMREMEGLTYAELGDALGVTIPAVKSLLVRARIGLAEAIEARDTACAEIRDDLALSYGKGVRASALARRHLRDCDGCRIFRTELRSMERAFASLAPSHHPFAAFAKLLGIGGAGSGAAAGASGGGAAAGGAGIAAAGAATTATKVAAIVCSAAITVGGAAEVRDHINTHPERAAKAATGTTHRAPATPVRTSGFETAGTQARAAATHTAATAAAAAAADRKAKAKAERSVAAPITDEPMSPHVSADPVTAALPQTPEQAQEAATGGVSAPDEAQPADALTGAADGGVSGALPSTDSTTTSAPGSTQVPSTPVTQPAASGPAVPTQQSGQSTAATPSSASPAASASTTAPAPATAP